ncbi:MAG: hypothetical protein M3N54_07220 [Acidobacteriota bacterium]|nr:hypothetical protein [Acidobacteriota bacterium]
MRNFTALVIFAVLTFANATPAATQKPAKGAKAPLPPKQGVKTPGVQIPFASVTAEATLPATEKPEWVFYLPDTPAGGGRGGGAGAGGGRGGGGRGGGGRGAGAPPAAGAPTAPAGGTGTIFIPGKDKLEKFETKTNKPVAAIADLKKPCGGMVSAFASLWVPTCGDGSLQRIDPKTSKVTATIPSGAANILGSIAASTDSIWLLTDNRETLSRIDPEQNAVVGEIRLPVGCNNLTFGETSLWMTCPDQNKVLRINPATNLVDKRIEVSGHPVSLVIGETSVWVLCGKDGKIDRIDPKTDKVTKTIDLLAPNSTGGIAIGDGYVWVTMTGFPIARIDPTAETVAQQFWGEGGGAITASSGALWLSHLNGGPNAGTVWRVDPKLILATLAE